MRNIGKTKCMVMLKNTPVPRCELHCGEQSVKQVNWFSHLGSVLTGDIRNDTEIKRRIGVLKTAFGNIRNVLTN